jgi:hypothetical protein
MDLDQSEVFRRRVTNAGLWRESAEHLLAAADTLWEGIRPAFDSEPPRFEVALTHFGPYYLVAGLSVESFIKALRVKQTYPRSGEYARSVMREPQLPPGFTGRHDLERLASAAKVKPLTQSEKDLLKRLSVYVQWAGRYPVATAPSRPAPNFVIKDDHDAIHRFINRVLAAYDALPRQPVRLNVRG